MQQNEKRPYIVIFEADAEYQVTKALVPHIGGGALQIAQAKTANEIAEKASDAVLILIAVKRLNEEIERIIHMLSSNPEVVCEIIAITHKESMDSCRKIMASGFNGIFDLSFLDYNDFRRAISGKIDKGFSCLENRIQQQEYSRLKACLAASPDAFIIFDENRKLFFVSDHYKKAYPKSAKRFIRGLDVMEAFEMCCAEQGVTQDDPRYPGMYKFWEKMDGETEFYDRGHIYHVRARKLPAQQGTIVTTTEITRYKNQQFELEEKSKILTDALVKEQEASAIQKQFINMVSHEFRTPLSIIDGNAQILSRRAGEIDEETIKHRTKAIRSAVSRLVNLMEGILSSNMLKTGKLDLVRENVNLGRLIDELCCENEDLVPGLHIKRDIELLPQQVSLDRKLISLVIGNLLSNAVKFSDEVLDIFIKGSVEDGFIHLVFKDKGIGIPENEMDKIFDRFYRTTTASGIPGTGIGLNLVKDLVELHGGKIFVDSRMGEGTTFEIFIPSDV